MFEVYMQQKTLADFVRTVMSDKNLSGYDVERRAGKRINQSYINRLKNGEARNPSTDKLKNLAIGLGVTEDEVFEAARGSRDEAGEKETLRVVAGVELQLDRSIKLSAAGKQKILDTIRWITEGVINEENNLPGK